MEKLLLGIKIKNFKNSKKAFKISHLDLIEGNNNPFYKLTLQTKKELKSNSKLLDWALNLDDLFFAKYFQRFIDKNLFLKTIIFLVFFKLTYLSCLFRSFSYRSKTKYDSLKINFFQKIWLHFRFVWWVCLQKFMDKTSLRPTSVNLVFNTKAKILLAKRHNNWIPGDIGWAWFQGGIETKLKFEKILKNSKLKPDELPKNWEKEIILAGSRELAEETNLDLNFLHVLSRPVFSEVEFTSVSMRRFLYQKLQYRGQLKFLVFWSLNAEDIPIETNWENEKGAWFSIAEAEKKLVPEKLFDLKKALEILGK